MAPDPLCLQALQAHKKVVACPEHMTRREQVKKQQIQQTDMEAICIFCT